MPGASGLRKVFKGQICDHHIYKCLQAASERWQETFQPQSTVLLMFLVGMNSGIVQLEALFGATSGA
jgi:hypothetical protein